MPESERAAVSPELWDTRSGHGVRPRALLLNRVSRARVTQDFGTLALRLDEELAQQLELQARRVGPAAKLANLEARVAELEAQVAELSSPARPIIWRVTELSDLIDERAATVSLGPSGTQNLKALVGLLHELCVDSGLICMPSPQVDAGDGDVEIAWINLRRGRSLALWFDDDELTLSWAENENGEDHRSPSNALIAKRMAWVIGA